MKVLILRNTNQVIEIAEEAIRGETSIHTDRNIYANGKDIDIVKIDNIPDEVSPYKYCYSNIDGFYINTNYEEYIEPEEKIKNLENQLQGLQKALAEITMMMVGGE